METDVQSQEHGGRDKTYTQKHKIRYTDLKSETRKIHKDRHREMQKDTQSHRQDVRETKKHTRKYKVRRTNT